ncbi:putative uncharacterized protein [Corynebacterium casei UCMA 3821]|uniref:Uncharacterized protein n=1 Tax=Corynebacterium casei UCMA 3821 TaxID=1110505 RepID=G7HUA4_9CORY|nr:putative uncharacterized protein [Corynebacterium casei UCMA 3821]
MLSHFFHGWLDINHDARFIRLQLLQRLKLRLQQRRRHEMARAHIHPPRQQFEIAREVHKHRFRAVTTNQVAVGALQRTAPDHQTTRGS